MSDASQTSEVGDSSKYVKYIRGCPFPKIPLFKTENIIAALDYKPLDGDIILCSYPKTGTTWLQYIVWQILHKAESFPPFNDVTHKLVPYVEVTGVKVLEELEPPRFYKSHIPRQLMTINDNAKYIYIHRHPSDTLASFYYFEQQVTGLSSTFNDYFERFMVGEVSYGDYFDHVLSFYSHRNEDNLFILSYEGLHKDKKGEMLRVAKFLGDDYYNALIEDDDLLQKIIEVTTFDYMKKNLTLTVRSDEGERHVNFFRKGIVGDGKNLLSPSQEERLQNRIISKMSGTEFVDSWRTDR